MSTRLAVMFLVACVLGCTPGPKPPVPVTRDALVGSWRHELPNDEHYLLTLFDSGIVGFIHANTKLPIARSFGRWSFDEGTLDLHIVGVMPEDATFPLANRLIAQLVDRKLALDIEGERTTWSSHDRYGAARAGAIERLERDERGWTSQVEAAESATPPGDSPPSD
ncbi:MAG: hypothetical protein ACKV2T_29100 [Kofleriaceae bacterium]